ncbi:hypothetical protein P152DRAFT_459046 [Eremomyces bilateralis CBS 781.70]|uniref:Mitochondrial import inner membrane translocase subunit n=1 Tax=Eremomyces bilateralis CBS 781.70 TaxID=1392243 RepID=A0A6G1G2Q5_9PEZI|nr:uncharacterized protein P152DRAFT_459046 [Eremomyces bilateralis CBS 781.70]KAF1812089.1 hypothetical protein P152DRAFT_459046 [Eremomyces bilateralis CBS 781.70]
MESILGGGGNVPTTAGGVDLTKLSDTDKAELRQFIQAESQKASLQQSIHSLTDLCFRKCITARIANGKLDKYEEPCMTNCVERFLDGTQLIVRQLEQMRR